MKILFLFFFITFLFSNENNLPDKLKNIVSSKVESVNGTIVTFESELDLIKGERGIIIKDLTDYKFIIADVQFLDSKNGKNRAEILPSKQLIQPYLPSPTTNKEVSVGDKILFRSLNNRAFIIAPNKATFDYLTNKFNAFDILSPDLLLGYLKLNGIFDPDYKTLSMACSEYASGILIISGSKKVAILDCFSNAKLYEIELPPLSSKDIKAPFYSRLEDDNKFYISDLFKSKDTKDNYFNYYDTLIK